MYGKRAKMVLHYNYEVKKHFFKGPTLRSASVVIVL